LVRFTVPLVFWTTPENEPFWSPKPTDSV